MDLGLEGKVFVVTGGSSGLGLGAARQLVLEGARVVLAARDEAALAAAVADLGEDSAVGLSADLTDPATPEALVAAAHDTFGGLDGALLSAGGPPVGGVLDVSDDDWRTAVDMLLVGVMRTTRAVVADLRRTGSEGAIAYVTSSSARSPHRGLATSNGLRPGVAMLAKELSDEVASSGIRVNTLIPGRIATPRLEEYDRFIGDEARASRLADIPMGRYGTVDEFGRVAAFVLSPAASYVNGTTVCVDGGALRVP